MSDANVRAQVLIVDDERDHAEAMAEALRKPGHVCTTVHSLEAARDEIKHGHFDVIVTDLVMETETAGLDVLALARAEQPHAETIMVTAHGDIPTAKRALQGGAYDFIEKPVDLVVLRNIVHRAAETVSLRSQNESLKGQVDAAFGFEGIIGESPAMRQVITMVRQLAPSNLAVLVTGESGTGKELVASAIHKLSKRASRRYVTFNAAGQAESLLEDQLFGHVRGAFTGADKDREGVFEYADKGTLFLDEIGDMPLTMQPKLLRVLETGDIVRLGSNESRKIDVRLVSDWKARARPSPWWPGGVLAMLGVHLVFAVSTFGLLVWVLWEAWQRFPVPPAPNAHGPRHRRMARLASVDLVLTALTGTAFYWLAFVAR